MEKCCKNCRHAEEDDNFFTPQGIAIGFLLGVPIPNVNQGELKCENISSLFYDDYVDEDDSCDNFETK